MAESYEPPFSLTPAILDLVAQIAEEAGRLGLGRAGAIAPRLRRENRIRSIQASLAIENNSLSLEQVTAVVAGKRILGPAREVLEVKNAFLAYEKLTEWKPYSSRDLLAAHEILMKGLADFAGQYRKGAVGIAKGDRIVHLAPPASRVPLLMKDLLAWLRRTKVHPLVASCVFHYELEFIHPFDDGNGRIGRLWQTLILSRWKAPLAWLPVESVIRERQAAYYEALAASDRAGQSTPFLVFLLTALRDAMLELTPTDQVSDQVSDQVAALLKRLGNRTLGATELMAAMGLNHRPTFRKNYLTPALEGGWIERTLPDKPNSPLQKYRKR